MSRIELQVQIVPDDSFELLSEAVSGVSKLELEVDLADSLSQFLTGVFQDIGNRIVRGDAAGAACADPVQFLVGIKFSPGEVALLSALRTGDVEAIAGHLNALSLDVVADTSKGGAGCGVKLCPGVDTPGEA